MTSDVTNVKETKNTKKSETKVLKLSERATFKDAENMKNTPAMDRFLELKREHSEYVLFYRMGDFYELFFEDAVRVSEALGLTLTTRSKLGDKDIPMCGVPFHAYELYLSRLIKMGFKVAIAEQTEDPKEAKKRKGANAIVRRDVVRLVTAGTLTEETMLDARKNNYIVSTCVREREVGLAWVDISTGAFFMQKIETGKQSSYEILNSALSKFDPEEILFEDRLLDKPEFFPLFGEYRDKFAMRSKALYNYESALNTLKRAYKVETLDSFGDFSKIELVAAGVLFDYIETTQKGKMPRIQMPKRILGSDIMEVDATTRRSLDLLNPSSEKGISLLKVIDKTITGAGARLLAERLSMPLMDINAINDRFDCVSFFVDNPMVRGEIREVLRRCLDAERAIGRLSIERSGPRDLYDLAVTLRMVPQLKETIIGFKTYQKDSVYSTTPMYLFELVNGFYNHSELVSDILDMIVCDREVLPKKVRDGGFIKDGAYAPLDYLRNIRTLSEEKCENLRKKYVDITGVTGLRVKNNSIIGYYVEVPSKSASVLIESGMFIHRQSVLNAVRFTTEELMELEKEVLSADEEALNLELEIFERLREFALGQADKIIRSAEIIAELDVASSLAELAVECNYVRPIVDKSLDFEVIEGRHPVVEAALKFDGTKSFVGNDCKFDYDVDRIWLLTGPNMAGKSTFLRQNALIAIMAQMGSFVPAKSARIGVVDKVFSRVGASDDLARGRSTFMVEMVETAAILNRATARSFVILDEIGRGTATFDGLSIAWSVVEHLSEVNKCRTIFATHYHELTKLKDRLDALSLRCMKIKEYNGEVIFMHEVISGSADRSYGIHVAKLAGLPELTVERAEQVLKLLEAEKQHKVMSSVDVDLPLFATLYEQKKQEEPSPVLLELENLDVDNLSPREALDVLYHLKSIL